MSSPNSTISSVSGKRGEREEAAERGWGSTDGGGGDEDDDGGETARKKLRLSREQSAVLEETFKEHTTLNPVSGILVFFSWCEVGFCNIIIYLFFWVFSEAQGGFGEAAESTASTSGSLVSEPKGKVRYTVT